MALEIKTVQQVNAEKQKTFLIYGDSGTGKTMFLGSVPGKTLILDINEGGTGTLQDRENIVVAKINTYQDIIDFMENFQKYHDEIKFDNVALDTIDHLREYYFRDILKKIDKKQNFDDWGKWNDALSSLLMFFKGIAQESKIKVFYLAHEKDWAESTGGDKIGDKISANLNQGALIKVNAIVDVIMNMVIRSMPVKDPKTKKKVIDKETGKVKKVNKYLGIIKGSERRITKFRTSLKMLNDKQGEFYFTNPKYAHIQKIERLEAAQNKENKEA